VIRPIHLIHLIHQVRLVYYHRHRASVTAIAAPDVAVKASRLHASALNSHNAGAEKK